MRLFTGLDLPGEVVRNLDALVARLKPAARIQWSPPANLHVTTKFIGEWPEERLAELKSVLAALPERPPIQIAVSKVGFFPNTRAPRMFWCGIDAPGLEALAADTDAATASLGVARENRAFSPHLTLGAHQGPARPAAALHTPSPAAVARLRELRGAVFFLYQQPVAAHRFRVH